jgi:hypothetical protein
VDDPAAVQRAELVGRHPEEPLVVREEVPGRRKEQGKPAGEDERQACHAEQRPAVADEALEEAAGVRLAVGRDIGLRIGLVHGAVG